MSWMWLHILCIPLRFVGTNVVKCGLSDEEEEEDFSTAPMTCMRLRITSSGKVEEALITPAGRGQREIRQRVGAGGGRRQQPLNRRCLIEELWYQNRSIRSVSQQHSTACTHRKQSKPQP